ncbi:MAG: M48 family metalloprotease [Candidatus Eisenbacteria bacterium]|nr:M48 family metalloprotease [Candidatus Eisenbacteria bacterium]
MTESTLRRRMGAVVLPLLLLLGCAAVSQINLIPTEDEVRMGAQFAQQIETELKILDDPVVTAYADSLGQLLAAHSARTEIAYRFRVVDSDEVNAFALPGGFVYINRGLIAAADDEAELAAVIAHEIGHVVAKHGAKQLTRQYGLAAIATAALGEDPGMIQSTAANILVTGALMKYSRDAENEADHLGVDELVRSGIEPDGMVRFFEKIREMQGREMSSVERFFSTHPPTEERIDYTRAYIASIPGRERLTRDSDRFRRIRERTGGIGESD